MLQHFAMDTEAGPVVAYMRGEGEAVAVMNCPTLERAQQEAGRINAQARALARSYAANARRALDFGRRSKARYFPDESSDTDCE